MRGGMQDYNKDKNVRAFAREDIPTISISMTDAGWLSQSGARLMECRRRSEAKRSRDRS
jgi:hypothetical protein